MTWLVGPTDEAGGRRLFRLALFGLLELAGTLALVSFRESLGDVAFNFGVCALGALAIAATRVAERCPPRRALALILLFALALRAGVALVPPQLSTDAYRYVWDGRVQNAGINPYRYVPAAPALESLRDEAIYPFINRRDYAVTIYPPAAEVFFLAVNQIGDSLAAMRLALVALECLTAAVIFGLLQRLGRPATRILAYAWHPLAVWEIAGNAHVDAAMLALMMLGLWLALALDRRVAAAGVLAVAVLFKPFAALALPAAWRPWDWRAPAVAVGVALLLYLPYLSVGTGVIGFLPAYLGEEGIETGAGFWLVAFAQALFGPLAWARLAYLLAGAVVLIALALWIPFGRDRSLAGRLRRVQWLLLMFLLILSPHWAWYYLLILPFAALFGSPVVWTASIAGFLLYDQVNLDLFVSYFWRSTTFNLLVLMALLLTLLRRMRPVPESSA